MPLYPENARSILRQLADSKDVSIYYGCSIGKAVTLPAGELIHRPESLSCIPAYYTLSRESDRFRLSRQIPEEHLTEDILAMAASDSSDSVREAELEIALSPLEAITYLLPKSRLFLYGQNTCEIDLQTLQLLQLLDQIYLFERHRQIAPELHIESLLTDELLRTLSDYATDLQAQSARDQQRSKPLLTVSPDLLTEFAPQACNPEIYLGADDEQYWAFLYPFGREESEKTLHSTATQHGSLRRRRLFDQLFQGNLVGNTAETSDDDLACRFYFEELKVFSRRGSSPFLSVRSSVSGFIVK